MPFAQLLPTLLRHAGDDLANTGLAHGGWVLQRLDEAPFDGGMSAAQAGVRDGEILYLRPHTSQLPALAFDDVPDVIATAVRDRPDRWPPGATRRLGIGAGAFALLVGALVLLLSGPPWMVPAAVAGAVAFLLLLGATTLSRAVGDSGAGALIGYVAIPYAFLAGLLGPARHTALSHFGAPNVLAGFAAVMLVATIAGFAVADGVPVFLGAAGAGAIGAIGAGIAVAFHGVTAAGIAAVTIVPTLAITPLIPTIAFRMGRVTLPPVPASAEDLRSDMLMVNGQHVLKRTTVADRLVTGVVSGFGMVASVVEVLLAFGKGWSAGVMCVTVGCALLLRSRVFRGRAQKLWLVLPGVGGLGALALAKSTGLSQPMAVGMVLAPLLLGALIAISVGIWLPSHRASPFWARAGDIVDIMLIVALVPLALGLVGLLDQIRGMTGSMG